MSEILKNVVMSHTGYFIECINISAFPNGPGEKLKTIEKDGVAGVAFKKMGRKADPFEVQCKAAFTIPYNALSAIQNLKNHIQGNMIDIYGAFGEKYENLVCINAECLNYKATGGTIWKGTYSSSAVIVEFALTVQYPFY